MSRIRGPKDLPKGKSQVSGESKTVSFLNKYVLGEKTQIGKKNSNVNVVDANDGFQAGATTKITQDHKDAIGGYGKYKNEIVTKTQEDSDTQKIYKRKIIENTGGTYNKKSYDKKSRLP